MGEFDDFSEEGRIVMRLAAEEAARLNHHYIGTEHILLGLLRQPSCIAVLAIKKLGYDAEDVRKEVETFVLPLHESGKPGLPLTPRMKTSVEFAREELRRLNGTQIDSGHLLIGLLREREGFAACVLDRLGLDIENVREELLKIAKGT